MMFNFFLRCLCGSLMLGSVVATNTFSGLQDCDFARSKCAYRSSCYKALHSYMVGCADVLAGRTTKCPFACTRALISLTSTEYGLSLSTCDCGENEFCRLSKERIEVCRPEVSHAIADDTVVSCSVAKWICAADTLCSTALDFYHRLCRPMFHGRKCTPRCNNSLAILDRQEKATKLKDCFCDGSEDFPCRNIRKYTQRLCYGKHDWEEDFHYIPLTTPKTHSGSSAVTCHSLLVYLIINALCVLAYRTCSGASRLPRTIAKNSVNRTTEISDLFQSEHLVNVSPYTRHWPWWWTSEVIR